MDEYSLTFEKPRNDQYFVSKFKTPLTGLGKGDSYSLRRRNTDDSAFVDGITKEDREKELEEIRQKWEGRKKKVNYIEKRDAKMEEDFLFEAKSGRGQSKKYLGRVEHRNPHNPYCMLVQDESGFSIYPLQTGWYEFKPIVNQENVVLDDTRTKNKKSKKMEEMWESTPLGTIIDQKRERKHIMLKKEIEQEKEDEYAAAQGNDYTHIVDTDVLTFDEHITVDTSHGANLERPEGFKEFDYMKDMFVEQQDENEEETKEQQKMESLLQKRKRFPGDANEEEDELNPSKKRKVGDSTVHLTAGEEVKKKKISKKEQQHNKMLVKILSYMGRKGGVNVPMLDLFNLIGIRLQKKIKTAEETMAFQNITSILRNQKIFALEKRKGLYYVTLMTKKK